MTAPGNARIEEILKYATMVQQVAAIFAPQFNKPISLGVAAAKIAAEAWNDAHPDEPPIELPEDPELIRQLHATSTRVVNTGTAFLGEGAAAQPPPTP